MPGAAVLALVLGGGNALGAYDAGACAALLAAGQVPDWVAGSSVGAITAALVAGGPPEGATARLRAYWQAVASPGGQAAPLFRRVTQLASALGTRVLGRPALFRPRLPGLGAGTAVYDSTPLRRTLLELVDFGRLNAGPMRVSVKALDLESGAELVFDSTRTALTVDHIMGSAALIPDFPPVPLDGRLLVDGSLADNLPLDIVLTDPPAADTLVYAIDPFPRAAPAPADLLDMAERQSDLIFATHPARTLRAAAEAERLRRRLVALLPPEAREADPDARRARLEVRRIAYGDADETAAKGWDFSEGAVARRWRAGEREMQAALRDGARPPDLALGDRD